MELLFHLLGYLCAALMGLALSLMGGGGSILAVPILVYFFGASGSQATYYSLLIVSFCAFVGVLPLLKRRQVMLQVALFFYGPSVLGVLFSRRILLQWLPDSLRLFGLVFSRDLVILMAFGGVMLAAALSMLIQRSTKTLVAEANRGSLRVGLNGLLIGVVTGFVGAGGGFLIVPALVNGLSLSMEKAVGTSLLIIALNSLSGFLGDFWLSGKTVDWKLVMNFLGAALGGVFLGSYLSRLISGRRLKSVFGWFVLGVSLVLLGKQFYDLFN